MQPTTIFILCGVCYTYIDLTSSRSSSLESFWECFYVRGYIKYYVYSTRLPDVALRRHIITHAYIKVELKIGDKKIAHFFHTLRETEAHG